MAAASMSSLDCFLHIANLQEGKETNKSLIPDNISMIEIIVLKIDWIPEAVEKMRPNSSNSYLTSNLRGKDSSGNLLHTFF